MAAPPPLVSSGVQLGLDSRPATTARQRRNAKRPATLYRLAARAHYDGTLTRGCKHRHRSRRQAQLCGDAHTNLRVFLEHDSPYGGGPAVMLASYDGGRSWLETSKYL